LEFIDFALKMSRRPGFADGIGFVFTDEDPFCGLDLDNVWPSDAAETATWARGILDRFANSYGEASPSGSGYKIWCRARAPKCKRWLIESGAIEMYDHARFFAVTGRSNGIMAITDHQDDIALLVANLEGEQLKESQTQTTKVVPIDKIPKGKRHPTLVSLAGTMFKRGMASEAIEAALLVVNKKQCEPPYGENHVQQIVKSAKGWKR
jgi:primase-polymerase (primpol)-like protein